jgi:hypothetical protein
MKKFIGIIVGVLMVVGLVGTSVANDRFQSGPFNTTVTTLYDYNLSKVEWTNHFENKTGKVIEVQYQFKVSYESTVPYVAHKFTYIGSIHRTRVQPYSTVDVSHVDYVPFSATQQTWYTYCGWRWTVNFGTPLIDTRP